VCHTQQCLLANCSTTEHQQWRRLGLQQLHTVTANVVCRSACLSLLGQLAVGKRPQCGPVLRYKDTLKVNLKQCGIDPSVLCDDTQDRSAWRTPCHEAVTQYEDSRVDALEHKRAVWKGVQPHSNLSAWPCDSCSRVCSSRIGLHAHQQTHR